MLSGKLLPIHFKPQPDELLSSWLVRLAIAHGVHPHNFWNIVFGVERFWRTTKIDHLDKKALLTTISEKTATSFDRVVATTFSVYLGRLYEKIATHEFSTWIMSQGNIQQPQNNKFGLQFCPLCLLEDKEPYFRLSWRLSFVVYCEKHNILLLDRCSRCNNAVNFFKNVTRGPFIDPSSFTRCHNCAQDLRGINSASLHAVEDRQAVYFQNYLISILRQGWVEVPKYGYVHCYLYFCGLSCLMKVLIRDHHKIKMFSEEIAHCYDIKNISFPYQVKVFDRLDNATRSRLLTILRPLLIDWPNGFIKFCQENSLWSTTWNHAGPYLPFWLNSIVDDYLNRVKYRASEQEIDSAINYIRRMGWEPNSKLSEYFTGSYSAYLRRRKLTYKNRAKGKCPSCHNTEQQYKYGLTKIGSHQRFICRKCKRKYNKVGIVRGAHPEYVRRKALRLHADGLGYKRIARRLSISKLTVYRWVKNSS